LMSPQTTLAGLKPAHFGGSCSATRPFSLIISSAAAVVSPPFLAESQMTTHTLVFQAQNKFSYFCYGKMCAFVSFALRSKGAGICHRQHHFLTVTVLATDTNSFSSSYLSWEAAWTFFHRLKI
jgi:hypothetical protein